MLKLKNIFSDNALFQGSSVIEIQGRALPETGITGSISDGKTVFSKNTVRSDGEGRFVLPLETPSPSFTEYTVAVSEQNGTETGSAVTLNRVLFGELWLASGQSNMEMQNHYMEDNEAVYQALSERKIRIYLEDWMGEFTLTPEEYVKKTRHGRGENWNWMTEYSINPEIPYQKCEDIGGCWLTGSREEFSRIESASALGTAAVLELYDVLNRNGKQVPVGFINASIGGSSGESWVPIEAAERSEEIMTCFALNGIHTDPEHWNKQIPTYNQPGALYNLKIAPLEGIRLAGVFWYQGENNISRKEARRLYLALMKEYYTYYRDTVAADRDFAVIAAQLYAFPDEENRCGLFQVNSAMADAADLFPGKFIPVPDCDLKTVWAQGRNHPIHPAHKYPLGKRFAHTALRARYGEDGIVRPARAVKYEFMGPYAYVTFDTKGYPLDRNASGGFRIADSRKIYFEADAETVSGDTIRLSSPSVPAPCFCSYLCGDMDCFASLFCGGIPVLPFASDPDLSGIQTHPWLDTEIESYPVFSSYPGGLDFFVRPTWRPEGDSEVCRDGNFTPGKTLRLRGENGSCGAYVLSYPWERLDFWKYSGLSFEIASPYPVNGSAEILCAGPDGKEEIRKQPVTVEKEISRIRKVLHIDFDLPENADDKTCLRLTVRFENKEKIPAVCSVSMEKFRLF